MAATERLVARARVQADSTMAVPILEDVPSYAVVPGDHDAQSGEPTWAIAGYGTPPTTNRCSSPARDVRVPSPPRRRTRHPRPVSEQRRRSDRRHGRCQGNDVIFEGTVSVPDVGAPVSLTTWAYWPLPPREITRMSCSLIPVLTGTWKPWAWTIDGSEVKLQ